MKISCTPVSDFGFPNSEIRMAYGGSGIPHHEIRGSRGGRGARAGGSWAGVTGWDMGCRTLNCYVNRGVGHWMTWGSLCEILAGGQAASDQTRNGGHWPTRKEERAGGRYYRGKRKGPLGLPRGFGGGFGLSTVAR